MNWISVKDKLPEPDKLVLTWDIRRGICKGSLTEHRILPLGELWIIDNSSGGYGTPHWIHPPTHWQPLPPPPETQKRIIP